MLSVWCQFITAAAVIVFAGVKLCHYGERIAQRSGLSRAWVGIILIAFVTSLPELATSMGAALIVKAPDLALGDLLGSNAFNLMALGFLFLIWRQRQPMGQISGRVICILFGIVLVGLVSGGVRLGSPFALRWFGLDSLLIFVVYILGMRLIYRYESHEHNSRPSGFEGPQTPEFSVIKFIIVALAIVWAGIWLAKLGDKITLGTQWGQTFVGSLFLAIITSFPEVVVAAAALKTGAVDMAIGALVGSNLFNLNIIPLTDIFYRSGPILKEVSSVNLLLAGIVAVLSLITLGSLLYRSKKKSVRFGFDSLAIIIIYLVGMYYIFKMS
jgi:cation:H+ antiporter